MRLCSDEGGCWASAPTPPWTLPDETLSASVVSHSVLPAAAIVGPAGRGQPRWCPVFSAFPPRSHGRRMVTPSRGRSLDSERPRPPEPSRRCGRGREPPERPRLSSFPPICLYFSNQVGAAPTDGPPGGQCWARARLCLAGPAGAAESALGPGTSRPSPFMAPAPGWCVTGREAGVGAPLLRSLASGDGARPGRRRGPHTHSPGPGRTLPASGEGTAPLQGFWLRDLRRQKCSSVPEPAVWALGPLCWVPGPRGWEKGGIPWRSLGRVLKEHTPGAS